MRVALRMGPSSHWVSSKRAISEGSQLKDVGVRSRPRISPSISGLRGHSTMVTQVIFAFPSKSDLIGFAGPKVGADKWLATRLSLVHSGHTDVDAYLNRGTPCLRTLFRLDWFSTRPCRTSTSRLDP